MTECAEMCKFSSNISLFSDLIMVSMRMINSNILSRGLYSIEEKDERKYIYSIL